MPVLLLDLEEGSQQIAYRPGESLRDILEETPWRVRSGCRGIGACGLCRVQVVAGDAGRPTDSERMALSPALLGEGRRLACQIRPTGDLRVRLLNRAAATTWRAVPELKGRSGAAAPMGRHVLTPGVPRPCGAAIDVGTTHLCLAVLDLSSGRVVGERRGVNPQTAFGSDVMTRLVAAAERPGTAERLRDAVAAAIGRGLLDIASREGLDLRRITEATMVGNTAMLALLGKVEARRLLDPRSWGGPLPLRRMPVAEWRDDWLLHPSARIDAVAPLGGFVGSDLLAGLVATRFRRQPPPALYIDFGTNSEIALWNGSRLLVTSAAGGPAFEGDGPGLAVPAQPGAVYRIEAAEGGGVVGHTIGGEPATGLCGSALVDLLAVLRRQGELSAEGKLRRAGGYRFRVGAAEFALGNPQVDALQRAKGAVAAGVAALCERLAVRPGELRHVSLAGEFGRFLDVGHAAEIGLLPALAPDRVEAEGNAALAGCADILLSQEAEEEGEACRAAAELLNLTGDDRFPDRFLAGLYLRPMAEA